LRESRFTRRIRAEVRRETLLEVLEERFGAASAAEFALAVSAIENLEILIELSRLALRCTQLAEFRTALQTAAAPRKLRTTRKSPRRKN
jgi:hypothetical protein